MTMEPLTRGNKTPIERDILGRVPLNNLEYFAMYLCDDDALIGSSVEPPSDSNMVKIMVLKRPRVLDAMGWTGFQRSHL
jgi:hypothetical protein